MSAYADRLEGELVGFTYQAEHGGFAVAKLRTSDSVRVIAVGPIGHVTEGQHVTLEGRWERHDSFGRQFKVRTVLVNDPKTERGLVLYLSSGAVQGLGKTFAQRVVDTFGVDALRIIEEDPQRLTEVPGIGKKRAADIIAHWEKGRVDREVQVALRGYGLGQALANRIIQQYGKDALGVVSREPYRLCEEFRGVGFRTADTIARKNGIALDAPQRAKAAILHVIRAAEGQGHCFLPTREVITRVNDLDVPLDVAVPMIDQMVGFGDLSRHEIPDRGGRPLYTPELERDEAHVAERFLLLERAAAKRAAGTPAPDTAAAEKRLGLTLNADQRGAVQMALQHGITVITGGPGTGKTTIVRVLLTLAEDQEQTWLLAAPTGRAARRLHETTGADGRTLHRLLQYDPRTSSFTKGPGDPLEADGILVDEASMVDIRLMAALLAAIPEGCRLVLVGDADQLPSVGPGRVLRDVIAAGTVPVATLREVYRQAADSGIVTNAWRVNQGVPPVSSQKDPDVARADFFIVGRGDVMAAQATVLQVVTERLAAKGFDPANDVQVLTPMHAGPLGTEALNERLQAAINPDGRAWKKGRRLLKQGDRVIQTRNDYDNDVFNGDIGRVVEVGTDGVVVHFGDAGSPGREVAIKGDRMDDLQLAYAISIHKSQGSEYPAVVLVLHRAHRIMLRRNLLYTGMTRAKRFCCLVGDPWAIRTATETPGGDERWTRLADRLQA